MFFITSDKGITGPYDEDELSERGLSKVDKNVITEDDLAYLIKAAKFRRFLLKEKVRLWEYVANHQELAETDEVQRINTCIEIMLKYSHMLFLYEGELIDISLQIDLIISRKD